MVKRYDLQEFASTTTIHGLPGFLRSKSRSGKIMWGFMLLASLSCLLSMGYKAAEEFSNDPTTLEWSIRYENQLPTIAISIQNAINGSKVDFLGLNKTHMKYLMLINNLWFMTRQDIEYLERYDLGKLQNDIEDTIKMHNMSVRDVYPFVQNDWEQMVDLGGDGRSYGLNLSLIPDGLARAKISAASNNLYGISQPFYMFHLKSLIVETPFVDNGDLKTTGYSISIGDSNTASTVTLAGAPNTANDIILNPEFIHVIDRPFRPCRKDSLGWDMCSYFCFLGILSCQFNCQWLYPNSNNSEAPFCRTSYWNLWNTGNESCLQAALPCSTQCYPPCQFWNYNEQLLYKGAISPDGINYTNTFSVSLRNGWQTSVYEEKYVYSWSSFISNVGGLMGLFFGASAISIFHLLYYLFIEPCIEKKYPAN